MVIPKYVFVDRFENWYWYECKILFRVPSIHQSIWKICHFNAVSIILANDYIIDKHINNSFFLFTLIILNSFRYNTDHTDVEQ